MIELHIKIELFTKIKVPKTKREEILDELAMLKAKKKKTKQDMDNIYTLEMILPNVK